jgi:phosphatidylinositol alpha-1,6-mannosyltransferase
MSLDEAPSTGSSRVVRHLLVTNDFPPKVGGIQSYLYELWRRLPPDRFAVLTIEHPGAVAFDAALPFPVHRLDQRMLLPSPRLAATIRALAAEHRARLIVLDPALPLGALGPSLGIPYVVVLHGAEVTVPARLPVLRRLLRHVLMGAAGIVAAGGYPAAEAHRLARGRLRQVAVVPPGVDASRFRPLGAQERAAVRQRFGLPVDALVVLSVSRLVPRKGMDVLVAAAARLAKGRPGLRVAIAGTGRDAARIARLAAAHRAPVQLLGRVDDDRLPGLYAASDVFAMVCRNRWAGLEQEGFGIVFLEAAAAGVPQVAGRSGGAHEAVEDGVTGLVVERPRQAGAVAAALERLLDDEELRRRMGAAARARAMELFDEGRLAERLAAALCEAAERARLRG